jgi:hypothetical protein
VISLGASRIVKLGVLIVKPIVALAVMLPEVPFIVIVAVPGVALVLAIRVKVLLLVAGFGENDAVTPLGRFEAERLTFPLNP